MSYTCQARVFNPDGDSSLLAAAGVDVALADAASAYVNANVFPSIRRELPDYDLDDLSLTPEDGEDGIPKCGLPAVEYVERGEHRWRVWLCAFHFDSYITHHDGPSI